MLFKNSIRKIAAILLIGIIITMPIDANAAGFVHTHNSGCYTTVTGTCSNHGMGTYSETQTKHCFTCLVMTPHVITEYKDFCNEKRIPDYRVIGYTEQCTVCGDYRKKDNISLYPPHAYSETKLVCGLAEGSTVANLSMSQSNEGWTNGEVILTAIVSDMASGFSLASAPYNFGNGYGSSNKYTVGSNGTYTVSVKSSDGAVVSTSRTVSNIDKSVPSVSLSKSTESWTTSGVNVRVSASDTGSGLADAPYSFNGGAYGTSNEYSVSSNGTVTVRVRDKAGNVGTSSIAVSNIDKSAPSVSLSKSTESWTTSGVSVRVSASDTGSGLADAPYSFNGGAYGTSNEYSVSSNGTVTVRVRDKAGNVATSSISVSNIDKSAPSVSLSKSTENWTESGLKIRVSASDAGSGLADAPYSFNGGAYSTSNEYSVSSNGTVTVRVRDKAGNVATSSITVSNIGRDPEVVAREKAEQEAREKAELEAKLKAEQEAKEKAELEAKLKAEQEAKEKAELEAKLKAEQEAKEKAELEAKLKAEQEAREKAELEAKLKAEQEAKEKAEYEAKLKAEQEAREKAELEAKEKAELIAKQQAELEAKAKAEQEAREKAEREAKEKAELIAKQKAELEAKAKAEEEAKAKAEQLAKEKAELIAKQQAELEAKAKEELAAKEKAELIAKQKAELEAKEKAEKEAREKAELIAKEKAELEAKQQAALLAKEKAEREAKEKAEQEAREKAELEAKQRAELAEKEKAEKEARERAEQLAKEKEEMELASLKRAEEALSKDKELSTASTIQKNDKSLLVTQNDKDSEFSEDSNTVNVSEGEKGTLSGVLAVTDMTTSIKESLVTETDFDEINEKTYINAELYPDNTESEAQSGENYVIPYSDANSNKYGVLAVLAGSLLIILGLTLILNFNYVYSDKNGKKKLIAKVKVKRTEKRIIVYISERSLEAGNSYRIFFSPINRFFIRKKRVYVMIQEKDTLINTDEGTGFAY